MAAPSTVRPPLGMTSRLTVVSGPAGVGKGTVTSRLAAQCPDLWVSVSATTRPPRTGEVHGVHYLFVSDPEFDELVATDALLEWAVVHRAARYGTPRRPVVDALAQDVVAIAELDLQGARQVRQRMPEARLVFLAPPSWEELVRRLSGRGTETGAQQQGRLETAKAELAAATEFDHVIVNHEVGQAVAELVGLLRR
ncbi:MAG: guanylate kinase [Propionibacteriaceae bacterium]